MMREWLAARAVYICRPGETLERLENPSRVAASAPIDGFVLEMADIWDPDL